MAVGVTVVTLPGSVMVIGALLAPRMVIGGFPALVLISCVFIDEELGMCI